MFLSLAERQGRWFVMTANYATRRTRNLPICLARIATPGGPPHSIREIRFEGLE